MLVGSAPETIALVTIGVVVLVLAGIFEFTTTKSNAIIPARLFKVRLALAFVFFSKADSQMCSVLLYLVFIFAPIIILDVYGDNRKWIN